MEKRVIAMVMSLSLMASLSAPVLATTVSEAGVKTEVGMSVEVTPKEAVITPPEPVLFSATIPNEIAVAVNSNTGVVTVSDSLKIINNVETKGIKVSEISVDTADNWTITDYNSSFSDIEDDTTTVGLQFRGDNVKENGTVDLTEEYWNIAKDTYIDLNLKAKFPVFNEIPENVSNFATIGFTLDWSGDDSSTSNVDPTPADSWTVTFKAGSNGNLVDSSSNVQSTIEFEVEDGDTVVYPAVQADTGYEFDCWWNLNTDTEIVDTTAGITSDMNIEARFVSTVVASDASWFVCDENGQLQGFSDVYEALEPKPTDIVIPEVVDGYTVVDIADEAFASETHLTSVIMPDTITSMQNACFASCSSLESVTLSDNLSSVGQAVFNQCSSLNNVVIPDSLTVLGDAMFMYCTSLADLEWHDNITSIGMAAFQDCQSLKNIELPANLKTIGQTAFMHTYAVTEWVIPNGVETLGKSAFGGMPTSSQLKSVYIPNTITSFGGTVFNGHSHLTDITLQDGLTMIGGSAFNGSSSLKRINIPSSVETIGDFTFGACTSLEIINIDKPKNSITGYANMWGGNNANTYIVWSDWEPSYLDISDTGYVLGYSKYKDYVDMTVTDMVIPAEYEGIIVTQVNMSAFEGDTDIKTLTVEAGVQTINVGAFKNCTNLEEINLATSVVNLNPNAFEGCTALEVVDIPEGTTLVNSNVFDGCTGLTEVNIPSTVDTIVPTAFANCTQSGLVINIDKAEDSIAEAPWGATNATINWLG